MRKLIIHSSFLVICLSGIIMPVTSLGGELQKNQPIRVIDTSGIKHDGKFEEIKADTLFYVGNLSRTLSLCKAEISCLYTHIGEDKSSYGPHLRIIGGLAGFAVGGLQMISKNKSGEDYSLMEVLLIAGLGLAIADITLRLIPEEYISMEINDVFESGEQSEALLHNDWPEIQDDGNISIDKSGPIISFRISINI